MDAGQRGTDLTGDPRGTAESKFAARREAMAEEQIARRGIRAPRVLHAMREVPRHEFVPSTMRGEAYADAPLPIGGGQTISQPYIVALMTEALELEGGERVLEVGAGSGYQAAILAMLAENVFAVERDEELAKTAQERLSRLGFSNVQIRTGDGTQGWPEKAPFDAILVAAAAPFLPQPLAGQLGEGGRLVIPIGGTEEQDLAQFIRQGDSLARRHLCSCRFVPLRGLYGWNPSPSP